MLLLRLLLSCIRSSIVLLIVVLSCRLIYFNTTASEIRGYYFAYPALHYNVGDLVLVCVSKTSYVKVLRQLGLPFDYSSPCPGYMPFLLKRIVAVAYDEVNITKLGIIINHNLRPYPHSQALESYRGINLLNQLPHKFRLKAGEYFLLGETTHSYDSRYFGVVQRAQIYRKAFLLHAETAQLIW